MRIFVYSGPTISVAEGSAILDAQFLPPIKHGDIIDALDKGAECLAIIDGYYDTVASSRHKEILQALDAGVRVLGSSSFGAWRAAELHQFGMEGIGEICQMYISGEIDGDDEVAVRHAPESQNFNMLSVPLVNLRHNLKRMLTAKLLDQPSADLIIESAKNLYFGARTLKKIFNGAVERGLSRELSDHCQSHFQQHWHDLKHADARLLLEQIRERLEGRAPWPEIKPFILNRTNFLYRWNVEQAKVITDLGALHEREIFAQLKFSTDAYAKARQTANERAWLNDYAQQLNIEVTAAELEQERTELYQREQLKSDADERAWLAARHLSAPQLAQFLEMEARVAKLVQARAETAPTESLTHAHLLLEYARERGLSARAQDIDLEWARSGHLFNADIIERLQEPVAVDLGIAPPKRPVAPVERDLWCRENSVAPQLLAQRLGERVLLRRFATNYYILPGIISYEHILAELKRQGHFQQALAELISIYQSIIDSGISTTWHPQWKVFVQSDTRTILEWFCKRVRLHSKLFQDYIAWQGFDELQEFLDISQLNYIYHSAQKAE